MNRFSKLLNSTPLSGSGLLVALMVGASSVLGGDFLKAQTTAASDVASSQPVRGRIVDADVGTTLPCRLYISTADESKWYFAKTDAPQGSSLPYDRAVGKSIERHVTLSAHPFRLELPPGRYKLVAEHGKEYRPETLAFQVTDQPLDLEVKLQRWVDMPTRGWYSGDTHVHRALPDLPNVLQAEDLHIIYPMSQWITRARELPSAGTVDPQLAASQHADFAPIQVSPNRFIVPLNSEYEIFSVNDRRHTLGAILVLGQSAPLPTGIPPLRAVADAARRQGALLDLEKHSWAWTPVVAPVMKVDLYPLSNNHVWRVPFAFGQWTLENNWRDNPRIETGPQGFTEWGWLHFGWEQYYALLNCGLRLRPTAGTGNAVHPVPAGFSRVYVRLGTEPMSAPAWQQRLNEGRSFVTTGPMLDLSLDDQPFGGVHQPSVAWQAGRPATVRIHGEILSAVPLERIELVAAGEVAAVLKPANQVEGRLYRTRLDQPFTADGATWLAVRCFEQRADGRPRFAHSAPAFLDLPGASLRPRRDQVHYLLQRCESEIDRNQQVLTAEELAEYREAAEFYRRQLPTAR
ncbi:MAG: CehA/McbA family metallohydrolase [Pirellulales bacterium]